MIGRFECVFRLFDDPHFLAGGVGVAIIEPPQPCRGLHHLLKPPAIGPDHGVGETGDDERLIKAPRKAWLIAFERLPDFVRLLYGRIKKDGKPPAAADIKKRVDDMFAAAALGTGKKK